MATDAAAAAATAANAALPVTRGEFEGIVNNLITDVGKLRGDMGAVVQAQTDQMQSVEDNVNRSVAAAQMVLDTLVKDAASKFQEHEEALKNQMGDIAKSKDVLEQLYAEAAKGWQQHQDAINQLTHNVGIEVRKLDNKISHMNTGTGAQAGGGSGDGDGGFDRQKSFLPIKNLVPVVFKGDVTMWRKWRNKVISYMETIRPGMKRVLEEVMRKSNAPGPTYAENKSNELGEPWIKECKEKLYRALQELTEDTPNRIIEAIKLEDGYEAWFEVNMYFEPILKAQQGKALDDLNSLMKERASNVAETRDKMSDLVAKIAYAEELTEEAISNAHARSVLLGFLDDLTRLHTVEFHGADKSFDEFKKAVMRFANSAVMGSGASAMQTGSIQHQPKEGTSFNSVCGHGKGPAWEDPSIQWENFPNEGSNTNEELNAIKGGMKCWTCGAIGHTAANCRAGGKAGGGGSKGGKAPGKGFQGSCWNCGGFGHSQNECTKGKGKGKGEGQAPWMSKGGNKGGYGSTWKGYGKGNGWKGGKGGGNKGSLRMLDGASDGGADGAGEWQGPAGQHWNTGGWYSLCRVMPIAQTETIKVTNRFKALTEDSVDEDFTEQDAKHQMLEFPLMNVKSKPRKRKNNEVRLKKRFKFRKSTEAKEIVKHFAEMVHKRRPEGEEIEEFSGDIGCNVQHREDPADHARNSKMLRITPTRTWRRRAAEKKDKEGCEEENRGEAQGIESESSIPKGAEKDAAEEKTPRGTAEDEKQKQVHQSNGPATADRVTYPIGRNPHHQNDAGPNGDKESNAKKRSRTQARKAEGEEAQGRSGKEKEVCGRWLKGQCSRRAKEMLEEAVKEAIKNMEEMPMRDPSTTENEKYSEKRKRKEEDWMSRIHKATIEHKKSINTFVTVEPEGLNTVAQPGEWTKLKIYVDSGATETVVGDEMLGNNETVEGECARRGVEYEVANVIRIPN